MVFLNVLFRHDKHDKADICTPGLWLALQIRGHYPSTCNVSRYTCTLVDSTLDIYTVNQLLFVTILFRDLPEINWFTTTYFCIQDVDYLEIKIQETSEDWFAAINIHDDEALVNLVEISRKRIKVGLQ